MAGGATDEVVNSILSWMRGHRQVMWAVQHLTLLWIALMTSIIVVLLAAGIV